MKHLKYLFLGLTFLGSIIGIVFLITSTKYAWMILFIPFGYMFGKGLVEIKEKQS